VKAHPADLDLAAHFTAPGQPSATVYLSSEWVEQSPLWGALSQTATESESTENQSIPK
jgi:hypothetical protein